MNSQRIDVLAINETKLDSSLLYPVIVILPSKICIVRYIIGKANPIYLGLNKMKFSRSPLITFDDFRDPPPPMTSSSKQIWGLPFWILPKFSAIPPFCSHKNQVAFFLSLLRFLSVLILKSNKQEFANQTFDFIRLAKFYCELYYVRFPNRSIKYAENHRVVDSLRRLGKHPIEKRELLSATYAYSRAILTHLRSCLTTSLLHP